MKNSLLLILTVFSAFCHAQTDRPAMEYYSLDSRTTLIVAYEEIGGNWIGANYLVIEGDAFSVLLDTPWDDAQTRELLAWSDSALTQPIELCVITHSHNDRMGGIAAVHERGINTIIHPLAQEMRDEFEAANETVSDEREINPGGTSLRVIYPGDGHAPGNLVVKIGRHGFYGGCFIKSANSRTLGNLADADIKAWHASLEKIAPEVEGTVWMIPGHGSTEEGAFERTRELVQLQMDELD